METNVKGLPTIAEEYVAGYCEMLRQYDYLVYHKKGQSFIVNIPLGSWDIMGALVPVILKNVPGDIVEIGMGESSTVFADHAYQAGVMLNSCDLQMGGMFKVFDKPLFENHVCFIGRSEDFIKEYNGSPSIVFIDGEHRYETIKMEVDFFLPRLKYGGVMFLHDTLVEKETQTFVDAEGISPGDAYKARQELERRKDIDVFTWPYSALGMGLTMVIKRKGDRA